MSSGKKTTIKDVARMAGVTHSTVSKVLNRSKRFSHETEQKVWQAAKESGYTPNPLAKSMVTGRTQVIGVKILDISNPYFANVVKGAQQEAKKRGYHLIVADSQEDVTLELNTVRELAQRSDGLLIVGSRLPDKELASLSTLNVPTILMGRLGSESGLPGIRPDNSPLLLALEHLIGLGHRDIIVVSIGLLYDQGWQSILDRYRLQGVTLTLAEAPSPDIQGGEAVARSLLREEMTASAVYCYNDLICYGVMKIARALKLKIPDDFSLVGADSLPFSDVTDPPLTSYHVHHASAGRKAMAFLSAWIEDDTAPPPLTYLESTLILRESTGPPKRWDD